MIIAYLALQIDKLAQTMHQHWVKATTPPPPPRPIPAWDDFSDISLINVNQFPIIEYCGYEAIIGDVVDARHGQPEMLLKLTEKLNKIYQQLLKGGPLEGKWQILQMTSQQIDQLKDLAEGRDHHRPPAPEPLSPYN